MYQRTWRKIGGTDTLFFLGATLAGYSWEGSELSGWMEALKQARFDLVGKHMREGYGFDLSPTIEQARRKKRKFGTRFGNCAETYPFIELLECVFSFSSCCVHC